MSELDRVTIRFCADHAHNKDEVKEYFGILTLVDEYLCGLKGLVRDQAKSITVEVDWNGS